MKPARRPNAATRHDYEARLLRVLVHIQKRLDGPIELEELARVACFSPHHFHRIFTGMVGESVQAHIRRLRLERAATQLRVTQWPVTRIAFAAGYDTHEAFTRAFKTAFGLAPVTFRKRRKLAARVAAPLTVHFHAGRFTSKTPPRQAMNVIIKTLKPMRVAFVRHVGPYHEAGRAWERLMPFLGKEGLLGGDTLCLGICHDDPQVTAPERIRYDACVTVDDRFQPVGEIGVQTIAGGDFAVTTHEGPYDRLNATYQALFGEWLPGSGRQPRQAPCFEVYLNTPDSTEPEDLLTDIHLPLE